MSKSALSAFAKEAIVQLDATAKSARDELNVNTTVMELTPEILVRNVPRLQDPGKALQQIKASFFKNVQAKEWTATTEIDTVPQGTYYIEGPGYLIIIAKNFYTLRRALTKISKDPSLIRGALGIEKYTTKAGERIERSKLDIGHTSEFGKVEKNTVAGSRVEALANLLPAGLSSNIIQKYLSKLDDAHLEYQAGFSKLYRLRQEFNMTFNFIYTVPQSRYINSKLAVVEKRIIGELRKELATLESSPSGFSIIFKTLKDAFLTGKTKPYSSKTKVSGRSKGTKAKKPKAVTMSGVKSTKGTTLDTIKLQTLINLRLHDQIRQNMGKGRSRNVLNYRTGRFARSAEASAILQTRQDRLDVFYTYQRFPYDTFAPGGRLFKPGRNPRSIIGRSIRQLAREYVSNNYKVTPVLRSS